MKSDSIATKILLYLIMLLPIIFNIFLIILVSKWFALALIITVPFTGLMSAIIHMLEESE